MLDKRGRNDAYMLEQEDLPEHLVQQLQFGLRSRVPNERERAIKQLAKTENREHKQVLRGIAKMTTDTDKFVRKEVAKAIGILSLPGDSSSVALLLSLCEDREWSVRYEAIKAMVLVECGPKSIDGEKNDSWKPAGKRVMDTIQKGIFDKQPEIRCVSAEATAQAIEDGDPEDLVYDMILTAGSNTMAIDKSFVRQERGDMSRTSSIASVVQQLGFGRTPSLGRTPSFGRSGSTSSQRSSKWLSAFERMKSNPDIERTEAYFSRLGQPLHMEGSSILLRIAHPPMSLDADVLATNRSTDALQGKVAIFALHPKRMTMAAIYDCAYRAERQKAIGAIFPVKKPELFAAERYDENEMQRSFDSEDSTPAPKKLNIPIVCISELMAKSIEDCALVSVVPNTSIVRGLIADENASVRAAALRTLCAVSRRNCPKLIDVLIELIVDKREEVRRVCVEAFMNPERVCPGNPMAIEELARISENEDWRVREASMIALCKVANCNQETCDPDGEVNNPVAIQAVIARLQDTEGLVKKLAIDGLITLALADGVIDEEDLPIIETLVESQADGDPLVATACSKALAFLSGESEDVTKVFPWMCDCRPQIRSISTRTLGNARIQNNCVILSMLRKRAADDFGQVRASAAFALAQVAEPGHKAAMVTIERLLGDTDAEVRSSAIEAMKVLVAPWGPNSQDSLKLLLRLVEMVKDSDTGVRTCASDALETCAGGSVEVLQALGEVLESHADFTVRKKALESMHRLVQPGDKQMLDAITIALRDARGEVRKLGFQLLKHHYEASKAAGVDVVALKESLLDCVKDADPMVVFVTIEAIPALFDQSDRMAVMALVRCLRHEAPSVREAATRVLGNFAERGDIRAIDYILPLIDHHMAYVRYACIIALMNLGVPGDPKVLEPVKSKLKDPEIFVRREAVTAIQYLSVRGDEASVSALLSVMDDPDERIRVAAMTGLSVVSKYGDPRAVASYMSKINLGQRSARKLAVECLACLILEDDYANLEFLLVSLEDTEHVVRQAGVEAVIKVVRRGDDTVIKRIMETKCQHSDRKIRAVGMQVLQGIALPGDQRIVLGMIDALQNAHAQVRKMAVEVICSVAHKGDDKVIEELAKTLADDDVEVRRAAVEGISSLAHSNDAFTISQISKQLASGEWFVRETAKEALLAVAEKGNEAALSCLLELLERTEWYAREMAIICMRQLSTTCSCTRLDDFGVVCECSLVNTMIEMMQDPYWKVRVAAMSALQMLASRRDRRVAIACRARIKDGDFNVRAAAEAMIRLFE